MEYRSPGSLPWIATFAFSAVSVALILLNLDVEAIGRSFSPRTPSRWIAAPLGTRFGRSSDGAIRHVLRGNDIGLHCQLEAHSGIAPYFRLVYQLHRHVALITSVPRRIAAECEQGSEELRRSQMYLAFAQERETAEVRRTSECTRC